MINPDALDLKSLPWLPLTEKHPSKPSQRELGDLLGITKGNYRRLENGKAKSINFDAVDKLCAFLIARLKIFWNIKNER